MKMKTGKVPRPRLHARHVSVAGKSSYIGGKPKGISAGKSGGMAFSPPSNGAAFQGAPDIGPSPGMAGMPNDGSGGL